MSKRIRESQNIDQNKRKLEDVESSIISQIENPLSDKNIDIILNSKSVQRIFFEKILYCINKNININPISFKKYLINDKSTNDFCSFEEFNLQQFIKIIQKNELNSFFEFMINYILVNNNNENFCWIVLFVCNILNNCPKCISIKYIPKIYLYVDSMYKQRDDDVKVAMNRIHTDILFPFLNILHEYKENKEISVIALKFITENDFKILFQKNGDDFLVKALPNVINNYIRIKNKWNWVPIINENLEKKLIDSIESYQIANLYIKNNFISIQSFTKIVDSGLLRINQYAYELNGFIKIFQNDDSIYGKLSRSIVDKKVFSIDYFIESDEFTIEEKIKLINSVIFINIHIFSKINNIGIFIAALNNSLFYDFPIILNLLDESYCNKIGTSTRQMRIIIANFLNKQMLSLKFPNNIIQILSDLSAYELSLNSIYILSIFLIQNRNLCFINPIFFKWYITSLGLSGIDIHLSLLDFRTLIKYNISLKSILHVVVIELRNNGNFIIYTNKIYWKINDELITMFPNQIIPKINDNNFEGIHLIWNKLNNLMNDFIHIPKINFYNVIQFSEILRKYEYNSDIEKNVFSSIFNIIYNFCKNKNQSMIINDLLQFISSTNFQILITSKPTKYLIKYHYFINSNKKFIKNIKNKINDFNELNKEFDKNNVKDCAICFEKSKFIIKLNCNCNYDFCAACISEMRHNSLDNCIKCPTCRKISSPIEEQLIF